MGTTREQEAEQHQSLLVDGVHLDICARRVGSGRWELSIGNDLGVRTFWMASFESPQAAIAAGIAAIDAEGVDEFASAEGFDYLMDW